MVILTLMLTLSFNFSSFANNFNSLDFLAKDDESTIVEIINDNNAVSEFGNRNIAPRAVGRYLKETVVSTQRKNHQFISYKNAAWSKVSQYTASGSFSVGYSIFGSRLTVSVNIGSSKTIPANPSRYSKLAIFADITYKKYKVEEYYGTNKKPTRTYYKVKYTMHNYYLEPKYK